MSSPESDNGIGSRPKKEDENQPTKRATISEDQHFIPPANPPSNQGKSNIFFKTHLCFKFPQGRCQYGQKCKFAHGLSDIRQPPSNWQELAKDRQAQWGIQSGTENQTYGSGRSRESFTMEHGSDSNLTSMASGSGRSQESFPMEHGSSSNLTAMNSGSPVVGPGPGVGVAHSQERPKKTSEELKADMNRLRKMNGIYGDWIEDLPPED